MPFIIVILSIKSTKHHITISSTIPILNKLTFPLLFYSGLFWWPKTTKWHKKFKSNVDQLCFLIFIQKFVDGQRLKSFSLWSLWPIANTIKNKLLQKCSIWTTLPSLLFVWAFVSGQRTRRVLQGCQKPTSWKGVIYQAK